MSPDSLLAELLKSPWSIPIAILCLSLSIFVHELGHFLVARWRGVHADRFSFFGLGKPIVGWRWKGVEWCICWIPIGAYVSIPQLADLGEIEGGSDSEAVRKLPSISYTDKVLISAAGAAFNIVLALLIGTVLWITGEKVPASSQTTTIGYVAETLTLPDKSEVASPAKLGGLQPLDVIRSIDSRPTENWQDIVDALVLGNGRSATGLRQATFVVERDGKPITLTVHPELATREKIRRIGIAPLEVIIVDQIEPGKPGALAGLKPQDRVVEVDGTRTLTSTPLLRALIQPVGTPVRLTVERGATGARHSFTLAAAGPLTKRVELEQALGIAWGETTALRHVPPHLRIWDLIQRSFRFIGSLFSRGSDIDPSKMSSPLGIVAFIADATFGGILAVLACVMVINVSFAVLNLLPIPVLDGGHILFATIAKLRGKPLPVQFVATTTFICFIGLIALMLYILPHDVRRATQSINEPSGKKPTAPAEPEKTPPPSTAPAKP